VTGIIFGIVKIGMGEMKDYWWEDLLDDDNCWQGLKLQVRSAKRSANGLEMVSGHHGRMALLSEGKPLFWASMLKDHSAVWLVYNLEHHGQPGFLAPITSSDVQLAKNSASQNSLSWWSRYFARQLFSGNCSLLFPGQWLLRPMVYVAKKPHAPYSLQQLNALEPQEKWCFNSPKFSGNGIEWLLFAKDFPDLYSPQTVRLVDWWWSDTLLLGRYAIDSESGRLKWWRKTCREGELPPILVWFVAGLDSFVILDGHYRLQAALDEGIPPRFLVLSGLAEHHYQPDDISQQKILHHLEKQSHQPAGRSIASINQSLINLYNTRYLYSSTPSRAVLGSGEAWAKALHDFLQRQHLQAYQKPIFERE
jgi:hypothetical protein